MSSISAPKSGGDTWKTLVAAVVGLAVVVAVGMVSYNQGVSAGTAKADQARLQALTARGIATPGQGAGAGTGTGQGGTGGAGFGGFGGARGGVFGTVDKVDGNTVTITQASDNTQATVVLSDTTRINVTSQGAASDLKQGQTITVTGAKGADGNYAATSISIVPAGSFQGQGGGQGRAQRTPGAQQTPQAQPTP